MFSNKLAQRKEVECANKSETDLTTPISDLNGYISYKGG